MAFKKADIISEEDIEKAKEFGIELDLLGARLDKMKVKIGMNIIDAIGENALLTGDLTGTALGNLLGINNQANKRGAEQSGGGMGTLKTANAVIGPFIDTFQGLTDTHIALHAANTELEKYNELMAKADSQDAYSSAAEGAQKARNEIERLSEAVAKETSAVTQMATAWNQFSNGMTDYGATNPESTTGFNQSWGVGQETSDRYSQVESIWSQAQSERRTSPYIQAILELSKAKGSDVSGGTSSGADWRNSSSNESIATQTLAAWDAYKATPSISLTVYATGSDQQIANDTEMAVSRALAAQVRV